MRSMVATDSQNFVARPSVQLVLLAGAVAASLLGCSNGVMDGDGQNGPDDPGSGSGNGIDGGDNTCAPVTFEAELQRLPVDLILSVDTSGSMGNEAARVQENINRFAGSVDAAGADLRVVVVSSSGFVAVPAPLGTDPTRLRFVEANVQSRDALAHILFRFEDYKDFLRPDAVTHVLVVTDDDSDVSPGCFAASMEERLGHPFRYHAIASELVAAPEVFQPMTCGCTDSVGDEEFNNFSGALYAPACANVTGHGALGCGGSARAGEYHMALVEATGGIAVSICTEDWSGAFDKLSEAVTKTALPCAFPVPAATAGYVADLSDLKLSHTPAGGAARAFTQASSAACTDGDWYLDAATSPATARLCQETCDEVSAEAGELSLAWECATPIL
jgi:hypothetical protein